MATYEYHCDKCGHEFSLVMRMSEHDVKKVKCPECKSTKITQKFSVFHAKTSKKS